jgi:hypothetical protein
MIWRNTATRRLLASAGLAVSVLGCGSGTQGATVTNEPSEVAGSSATPATTPAVTSQPTIVETPEASRSASPRPAATPAASTFESPFYRYAITLPPGAAMLAWRPAQRLWDGTAKLDRAGPLTDRTTVAEGGFYLFGAVDASLETWFARVEANGTRFHGCTPAQNRVDVTINGVPAIAFTQSCALGTHMARVALWEDGYGIGVWLGEASATTLVAVRDRAVELLATLEWKTG